MSDNYEDILDRGWDEIPEVKPLPVGSWLLKGRNASYQPAKTADKSPSVLFVYEPKEPMDDVDEAGLADLGKDYEYGNNRIFFRKWIETSADWDQVRNHLTKHGVDVKGSSIKDTLAAFKGTEVIAYLNHRSFVNAAGESQIDCQPTSFSAVE